MTSFRFRSRSTALAMVLLALAAACSRHPQTEDEEPLVKPDPIHVHVRNENFLDVNVFMIVNGASRRLGTVTGNGSGDFTVDWGITIGQSIALRAVPIGGSGSANTGQLSIGLGEMIEFTVAPVLRQSTVSVHEPP
ncbi:MAG TPA: hypothetical protein VGH04_07375 [Gemmatimonadaceae bacterium]|jgi:hypothetical protein